eukprot:15445252-Alexandrium_andersonii.AAC.1
MRLLTSWWASTLPRSAEPSSPLSEGDLRPAPDDQAGAGRGRTRARAMAPPRARTRGFRAAG